jgi:hypothetical protein
MGTGWASTFQSSRRHDRLGSRGHQGNNNITPTVVSGGRTDALAPAKHPAAADGVHGWRQARSHWQHSTRAAATTTTQQWSAAAPSERVP